MNYQLLLSSMEEKNIQEVGDYVQGDTYSVSGRPNGVKLEGHPQKHLIHSGTYSTVYNNKKRYFSF